MKQLQHGLKLSLFIASIILYALYNEMSFDLYSLVNLLFFIGCLMICALLYYGDNSARKTFFGTSIFILIVLFILYGVQYIHLYMAVLWMIPCILYQVLIKKRHPVLIAVTLIALYGLIYYLDHLYLYIYLDVLTGYALYRSKHLTKKNKIVMALGIIALNALAIVSQWHSILNIFLFHFAQLKGYFSMAFTQSFLFNYSIFVSMYYRFGRIGIILLFILLIGYFIGVLYLAHKLKSITLLATVMNLIYTLFVLQLTSYGAHYIFISTLFVLIYYLLAAIDNEKTFLPKPLLVFLNS